MLKPDEFAQLVAELPYKKNLPDSVYLHRHTLAETNTTLSTFVEAVAKALNIPSTEWNLVKLGKQQFRISLLHYPDFEQDSYPALVQSVTVDLAKLQHRVTTYSTQDNPPILHRKETLISPNHPLFEEFQLITQEGEAAGLYQNSRMIGFKQSWQRVIAQHGFELVDGRLFRSSAVTAPETSGIERHKTAIVRHELSTPMKTLAKHGYLNGDFSIFDYGCGRGDDLRELEAHGLDALGWDPNFYPESDKISSDLVNIGFVINVIEDPIERTEAIVCAWELTEKLLVISAMLANDSFIAKFKPYKDGVITSRNTFQKYYSQSELQGYIERVLDEYAIAVGAGVFYVFKDKLEEQRYLSHRQRRHQNWKQLTTAQVTSEDKARLLVTTNKQLFDEFWLTTLTLGRLPVAEEFDRYSELKQLCGSSRKALAIVTQLMEQEPLEQAKQSRTDDLLVYLALNAFGKRQAYAHMPDELKRDIKAFFGTNQEAQAQASQLLYSIADYAQINQACAQAHIELPASIWNQDHSLVLHKNFIPLLSPLLRIYIGAATQLYGELDEIDLVKIHTTSGKVSLMGYDNFLDSPIPRLRERIKIRMEQQEVDFFDYINEENRPPFLHKFDVIDETFDDFAKQQSFDNRARKIGIKPDNSETHLTIYELNQLLSENGIELRGYRFFSIT